MSVSRQVTANVRHDSVALNDPTRQLRLKVSFTDRTLTPAFWLRSSDRSGYSNKQSYFLSLASESSIWAQKPVAGDALHLCCLIHVEPSVHPCPSQTRILSCRVQKDLNCRGS